MMVLVPQLRMSEAARLLGVSDDTVRRWADAGRLPTTRGPGGRMVVDGADLAALAQELAEGVEAGRAASVSARNRMRGIVTKVIKDTVMAQVEVQAGPFRIVSLLSREAADELALAPGSVVIATVKATNVGIEVPE
jgi:molybdopterin-binding protein